MAGFLLECVAGFVGIPDLSNLSEFSTGNRCCSKHADPAKKSPHGLLDLCTLLRGKNFGAFGGDLLAAPPPSQIPSFLRDAETPIRVVRMSDAVDLSTNQRREGRKLTVSTRT